MPEVRYRMFSNDQPFTRAQLDAVETITVEQEQDIAWEARISIPLATDENGHWLREDEDYMAAFSRLRVEIKVGTGDFIPLIDGPVVSHDADRAATPGQSMMTLVVQDDSVFLNRDEEVATFTDMLDYEIAARLFEQVPEIATTDIDDTPTPGSSLPAAVVQRGTPMQLLRTLARRNGMHVYVLPGGRPGQSVGCFKTVPADDEELPELTLLGPQRDLESFRLSYDGQRPGRERTSILRIRDKQVVSGSSESSTPRLLGDEEAAARNTSEPPRRLASPYTGETVDPDHTTAAGADQSGYAHRATGQVRDFCYPGVLRPYRLVTVRAGDTRESGRYLVTRVTHTLTRSTYTQSFTCIRNADSTVAGRGQDVPVRGIL